MSPSRLINRDLPKQPYACGYQYIAILLGKSVKTVKRMRAARELPKPYKERFRSRGAKRGECYLVEWRRHEIDAWVRTRSHNGGLMGEREWANHCRANGLSF